MHSTDTHDDIDPGTEPQPIDSRRIRRRLALILAVLLVLLLLVFIPPLVSVNRFQRRIAANIGASLGRPVHFDRVSLTLLPMPGFTLENFVVEEDPAFGSEPILRAGEVRATLRIGSLWRKRVEVSRISLSAGDNGTAPSVNLVHRADGRWNIEGLLLQASHIEAAPTAQPFAGPAPRFPYVEATGARVNLKLDQEKTPFSLADADFALWLPQPHQWHLRVESHPVRTDISPGETGTLRLEGILGSAQPSASPIASIAQIPIDLHGDWRDAQLGGLSSLLIGRDAGLRGEFALTFAILGTLETHSITSEIKLDKARRAAFVPAHPLSLDIGCQAKVLNSFHSFSSIECHWPPADSSNRSALIVTADLPDVRQPASASATFTVPALPASTFFDWLGVATQHPPTGFAGTGTLAGSLAWNTANPPLPSPRGHQPPLPPPAAPRAPTLSGSLLSGSLRFSGEALELSALGPKPIPLDDLVLRSTPLPPPASHSRAARTAQPASPVSLDLLPIELPLGGKQPAILEGHFDASGYTLHLTGSAIPDRLLALAQADPQFGDGLADVLATLPDAKVSAESPTPPNSAPTSPGFTPEGASTTASSKSEALKQGDEKGASAPEPSPGATTPIHLDLTASRSWGAPQTWRETTPTPSRHHPRH
jgi:AsmA protein